MFVLKSQISSLNRVSCLLGTRLKGVWQKGVTFINHRPVRKNTHKASVVLSHSLIILMFSLLFCLHLQLKVLCLSS